MNGDVWSPEELEELNKLWLRSVPAARIAAMLNRTKNGVLSKVYEFRTKKGESKWPMRQKGTPRKKSYTSIDRPPAPITLVPLPPSRFKE